ncbi:hypothetical protein [Kineosporia sp. NBRC 101731]|uniref:hypothetical protein n=1 Tax=Kineosporia sp. NBRC 101731 TaxID=3032199 RepID=UPI00255407B9|nr:hypothetical protein [Kineosporia sp. NBRC 101731]
MSTADTAFLMVAAESRLQHANALKNVLLRVVDVVAAVSSAVFGPVDRAAAGRRPGCSGSGASPVVRSARSSPGIFRRLCCGGSSALWGCS